MPPSLGLDESLVLVAHPGTLEFRVWGVVPLLEPGEQLDQASRDLGFGPVEALDPGDRGAGDIAYVSHLLPGLDGIGIGGGENSHAKGEAARVDTMPMLTKRAAVLIYRLTR